MQKTVLMSIVSAVAVVVATEPAHAILQFQKEFVKLYVADDEAAKSPQGSDDEPSFAELAKGSKTKCLVCHQGKKRKNKNPYGEELAKLLDKKKDKKDTKKIVEALEKVGKMHSDAKDDKSPTYAELIKAGKLPGGSLEEVKKEPKAE